MFTSSAFAFELVVDVALFGKMDSVVLLPKLVPPSILFAVFVGKMVAMLPPVFGVEFVVAAVASIIIGACWPFIDWAAFGVGVVPGICIKLPLMFMICG